jgi:hypothetical protein
MNEDFEDEQKDLKIQNITFREKITKVKAESQNVDNFVKLAKSTALLGNLTPEKVRELLERIEISEKTIDEDGEKTQKVRLFYRFVGALE